jgi:DNA anti-recombination protein RmuC
MECKDFLINEDTNCELKKIIAESEKRVEAFQQENANLLLKMTLQNDKMYEKLEEIHTDVKRLIVMLEPVHSHAEWVDGLRARLHSIGLMRNTPRIE